MLQGLGEILGKAAVNWRTRLGVAITFSVVVGLFDSVLNWYTAWLPLVDEVLDPRVDRKWVCRARLLAGVGRHIRAKAAGKRRVGARGATEPQHSQRSGGNRLGRLSNQRQSPRLGGGCQHAANRPCAEGRIPRKEKSRLIKNVGFRAQYIGTQPHRKAAVLLRSMLGLHEQFGTPRPR
jgi:hypothetical protein